MFQTFLMIHIAAGTLGLILGPVAMFSRKRKGLHTGAGNIYHWLMLTVCVTACFLAVMQWERSWYLLPVSIFSYAFAAMGFFAAKRRGKLWLVNHITGMLGSYIALTTALLVVNARSIPVLNELPAFFIWLIPTIIGSPAIGIVLAKNGLGRKMRAAQS